MARGELESMNVSNRPNLSMTAPVVPLELHSILQRLAQGERTVEEVYEVLSNRWEAAPPEQAGTAELRVDTDRARRCGFPEVIYAPGKSNDALQSAFACLQQQNQNALATRVDPEQAKSLLTTFPDAVYNSLARTVRVQCHHERAGRVVVITAGTSDRPVGEEALETLHWMGVDAELLMDVGVAGPQRFLSEKHRLDGAHAVVVVAGMEGALPSVVGGWVACPVFAVPTSVGYGASFGGITALLGMLNSCAANVAVVNIDAGFKGAYLAGMTARQAASICNENQSSSMEMRK